MLQAERRVRIAFERQETINLVEWLKTNGLSEHCICQEIGPSPPVYGRWRKARTAHGFAGLFPKVIGRPRRLKTRNEEYESDDRKPEA